MRKKVSWGIIGCGDVTEVKSGPAFSLTEGSELVAVMRRDEGKARDYARRHGVPKWYGSAEALIADPSVTAIYVATPPDTHAYYAIRSMEAGKPVYVEKPMARSYSETLQMMEVSERTGVPLFVAYYRRALPGFLRVKALLEEGAVGRVQHVEMQLFKPPTEEERSGHPGWRVDPAIAGGGHFFDLASHQLDYLDFLFGPVRSVSSLVHNFAGLYPVEDFVSALFAFDQEIVCSGTWNFAAPAQSRRDLIEITGTEGSIRFSCFDFVPVIVCNSDGIQQYDFPKPAHVQMNLIEQIVGQVLSDNPQGNAASAVRTSRVLEQVVEPYYRSKSNL